MLENLKVSAGLGKSDHQILLFDFNCYISLNECKSKKYNFFKGNYNEMNKKLSSYNWNDLFSGMSLINSWDCFTELYVKLLEKFVSESKAPTRMANHNPYVNSNVLSSIKEKREKWLKFKYCHTENNHRNYKMSCNHVVSKLRLAKYQYEKG